MTDDDRTRTVTTAPHPAPGHPPRRRPWWVRRWPTALAVLMSALTAGGGTVDALAPPLVLLPTAYVVVAALGRPRATWPVVVLGTVGFVLVGVLGAVDPRTVVLVAATAVLGAGLVRHRHPAGRRTMLVQGAGLLVFGAVAVLVTTLPPEIGVWPLAAAWFAHGVWDLVHLRRRTVVSPTFAEWCAVVDVLVAVQLVLFAACSAP
ncbi:hypothetical protein [Actinomycetospora atypica]|uniref:Uncharacterized protein n=1 Tax=Actinomycetospora atypica TaxID=1290095 RepID=A0ABV9YXD3_9PSEU